MSVDSEETPPNSPVGDVSGGVEGDAGDVTANGQLADPVSETVEDAEATLDSVVDEEEEYTGPVEPLELIEEPADEDIKHLWYILKVQVNREDSIKDSLLRRVKVAGLERYFADVVVPTEDVVEFTKSGKRKVVKRKLYPGYIVVKMAINDDSWFLVRETSGIGDFTGPTGKPAPMPAHEIEKILKSSKPAEDGDAVVRTAIPFKGGDRVRVKEGYFQNFEGDVESIDEANGRVTVMINIFGRSTPVELEHWQIEAV